MLGGLSLILSGSTSAAGEEEEPEFSPLDIDWDAAYWASNPAQSFTADQQVTDWDDASGNGIGLSDYDAAPGINQPLYRASVAGLNNKPALQFDGSNDWLATTVQPWAATSAWDLVVVFKQASVNVGTFKILVSTVTTGSNQPEFLTNADSDWWMYGGASITVGTPDTTAHCLIARYNTTSSEMELDGSVIGTGNVGTFQLRDLVLGLRGSAGTFPWGGHMAFVGIKRTTLLTTQERSDLVDWSQSFYATP